MFCNTLRSLIMALGWYSTSTSWIKIKVSSDGTLNVKQ